MERLKRFFFILILITPFVLVSLSTARPPKPGPNFVWVAPYVAPGGVKVPGHWRYTGPDFKNKVWVPGHYDKRRKWIPGHWKAIKPGRGRVWIRGHYDRHGRWVPGHWKKMRPPKGGKVWVRGHYDRHGNWVPGHWR